MAVASEDGSQDTCGRTVDVPRLSDLAALEARRERAAERPAWDFARGLLLAGCATALVAAVAALNVDRIGAWFFPQPPDATTIHAAVMSSSTVDIYSAWRSFAVSGVRRLATDDEVRLQQFATSAGGVAALLWGVAGIGAVVAAAGGLLLATRRGSPGGSS
jgi:hypothetical protein